MSRRGQSISWGKLRGEGIIPVLFIIGVFLVLVLTQVSDFLGFLGYLAIASAVIIGIIFGIFAILGMAKRHR